LVGYRKGMSTKRHTENQRRGIDVILAIFVVFVGLMWVATGCDYLFGLGWGWDTQILWLGPLMVAWGLFVRFCAKAIFTFFGSNF
jgi:hypothetical protein